MIQCTFETYIKLYLFRLFKSPGLHCFYEVIVWCYINVLIYRPQFLIPAIRQWWVQINASHCPLSFVKLIAYLNVSPSDAVSSFVFSIQHSLCLSFFLFPSSPTCSARCGILPTGILAACPDQQSLYWMTLSSRVFWERNYCFMSSIRISAVVISFLILLLHCPTLQPV